MSMVQPVQPQPVDNNIILVPVGLQANYRKPGRVQLRELDHLHVWFLPGFGGRNCPDIVYGVHFVWARKKTDTKHTYGALREPYYVSRCQFRALILAGVPIEHARATANSRFFAAYMCEEESYRREDRAHVMDQVPAIAGEEWSEVTWALAKEILEELLTRAKVGRLFADRLRRQLKDAYHLAAMPSAERCRQARWAIQVAHNWAWGREQWERRGAEWK